MTENQIAKVVYVAYKKILSSVGSGLLEKAYQEILTYELRKNGLSVETEVLQPIVYEDLCVQNAYRMDIWIDKKVVIELKAQDQLLPIHEAQLLTYLKMNQCKLGLLINFGGKSITDNFKRIINCKSAVELDVE